MISSVKIKEIRSRKRFDAMPYVSEDAKLTRKIDNNINVSLSTLGNVHKVRNRDSRIYVENIERGVKYLSNSNMQSSSLDNVPYMSKKFLSNLDEQLLKEGDILVSAVGTIGLSSYVNKDLTECVISGNILRFTPNKNNGFIYAYLQSKYGIAYLKELASGSVQDFITPPKLGDFKIPILPEEKQQQIHQLIVDSANLRVEANKLLKEAVELMESQLNTNTVTKGFQHKKITSKSFDYLHKRFDAQYQVMWKAIKDNYSDIEYKKVGDFAENIFVGNRGKRHYVNEGIPFLSSSDMMLFNPLRNSKQISKNSPGLESMKVQKKDILISRSGTVGNTVIVGDYLNNVAISEHALRLRIDSNLISPNYVFTYLKTNVGLKAMEASAFGSVIITLNEELIADIDLPILSKDIVLKIDNLIDDYLIKLDSSTDKENQAINLIENEIDAWQ